MNLQYYKIFSEDTSQGIVGLLKPLKNRKKEQLHLQKISFEVSSTDYFFILDEPSYPIYVFKIPKEVNTLVDHELKVSRDMEELGSFLPHYNRIYEVQKDIKCYIPEKSELVDNFNPFSKYNCVRDVAIIEYIPSKTTLLKYIKDNNFYGCTESLIHQLILALFIAQEEKKFTHYDLHLENILLRKCDKRTFFWYKFMYEDVMIDRLILTNGFFPVIFDYGFAYSKGLEGTSYNNSLFFTNKGYTPFKFDPINDFKTLMVRLAYIRGCPIKYKQFAQTHFLESNQIKLCKETGWVKTTLSSAARIISKRLDKILVEIIPNYKDNFIYKELDNIIDLFSVLIKLPFSKNDYDTKTLVEDVRNFTEEWNKIDEWFNPKSTDDKLNIIKKVIGAINDLIGNTNEQKYDAFIHNFKLKFFEILDGFGDFINVYNIDYGKFISSTIQISNFIEYITYAEIQRSKKFFNFANIMSNWSLFNSIEKLVEPKIPYNFQKNDSIVLFNCVEKSTSSFELKDEDIIKTLNTPSDVTTQISLLDSLHLIDYY